MSSSRLRTKASDPPGGAVADRDRLDGKPGARLSHCGTGGFGSGSTGVREDRHVVQQRAVAVEDGALAAGPKPRIDRQDRLVPQWRRHQHLAQVGREHVDGLLVRPEFYGRDRLLLERGLQEPLVGVGERELELLGCNPSPRTEPPTQPTQRLGLIGSSGHAQVALGRAAQHRQDAVRRRASQRLAPVEVVAVLRALLSLRLDDLGRQSALVREHGAQLPACRRVLADALGDDVPRTCERVLGALHASLAVHEGPRVNPAAIRSGDRIGQRLQAALPRRAGPSRAPGTKGQVEVFELGAALGTRDATGKLGREQSPLVEGGHNRLAALVELGEQPQLVPDGRDGDLVQRPGGFLSISRDEGDGGLVLEQPRDRLNLLRLQRERRRDAFEPGLERSCHGLRLHRGCHHHTRQQLGRMQPCIWLAGRTALEVAGILQGRRCGPARCCAD